MLYPIVVLCFLGCVGAQYSFCRYYLGDLRGNRRLWEVILFLGVTMTVIVSDLKPIPYIVWAAVNHLLFGGWVMAAFREKAERKILAAVIPIVVVTLISDFCSSLLSIAVLIVRNAIRGSWTTGIPERADYLISCVSYSIVIFAIHILKKRLVTVFEDKVRGWYFLLSVPLIFIVVMVDVVNWGASNGIMVVSDANGSEYWNVYYNQIFSHLGICLLTALSLCIAGGFVFGMNRLYLEQREKEQYHSQIAFYQMLNEQYMQMERLRHDMKNHLLSLYTLWERGETEKTGTYIKKMLESGNIGINDEVTGNRVIDALLYHKRKQAEMNGICWESNVQIPANFGMDEFDLCVLFGNILDNALHAGSENEGRVYRFVNVVSQRVKNSFLLVVKNGTVLEDIKEMKQGIGMLNIREMVKKYHGIVSTKVEAHVFEISVLLPVNTHGHDRN